MNRREFIIASAAAGLARKAVPSPTGNRIDRAALVKRHYPLLTEANINSPPQVGNGKFAFTADVTGLQTFAEEYLKGMPLGTLSDWGWHSFPNPEHYRLREIMRPYDSHGREVPYADGSGGPGHSPASTRIREAVAWLRQNPHRIEPETMLRTFQNVSARWNWDSTWGWDYPAMAMTAARLREPEKAMDVLMMDVPKNRYLPNGHCFQQPKLPLYLPANGGLLYATAMMAAGWHGARNGDAPGFPRNGRWIVKYEGLLPAL